jgi:hypothetical protein
MSDRASEGRQHGAGDGERPSEARGAAPSDGGGPVCDLCGAPMIDRHCKLTCPTCGYQRDCSDP